MTYDIQIDELQEAIFVEPIFSALIKNNAPVDLLKNVFFDTSLTMYFKYLPSSLKTDPDFIKECIEKKLICLGDIPENLLNKSFMSKELYISLISSVHDALKTNLYPQDEEIVLAALESSEYSYYHIEEKFKTNDDLMLKCMVKNCELIRFLQEEVKQKIFNSLDVMKQALKENPEIFKYMDEEQKYNPEILKTVLTTEKGYLIAKGYFNKTKDPEVALMVLKIDDKAKDIHQMYNSILIKNNIKDNRYSFLKIYLAEQSMNRVIPHTEDQTPALKTKI